MTALQGASSRSGTRQPSDSGAAQQLRSTDRPSGLSVTRRRNARPHRRSSPRLATFDYTGSYAYSITVNTIARRPAFSTSATVHECLDALVEACAKHAFAVHAYCFMPDHLHLLIEGSESSSLASMMKRFKQVSSYRHKKRTGSSLWQRSYFDHILRQEEDRNIIAEYVWNNPVQAGLVANRESYPFSGPREMMGLDSDSDRPEGLSLRSFPEEQMTRELRRS